MELALFDFDGTISNSESTDKFIKYSCSKLKIFSGKFLLIPLYFLYVTGLLDHHNAKVWYLTFYFKGMRKSQFLQLSREFAENHISDIVRPAALKRIKWHKDQGHEICVVTGSCELWLEAWCKELDLNLIGTRIDLSAERLSGKLASTNCFKEEKANRIKQKYDLRAYETVYAYGDSKGDLAMFKLADQTFYKPFRKA